MLAPQARWPRAASLLVCCLAACESPNVGVTPPDTDIFFPAGMVVDPRPPAAGQSARRWMFLSNSNSDRNFAGGTLMAVDLDAFWAAWYDPEAGGADPYCNLEAGRCVQPPGAPVDASFPCRHLAQAPQVIECDERPFVVDAVQTGNFGTRIAVSFEPDGDPQSGRRRLWLPVRGEPSITYVDVIEEGGSLRLDCGQDRDAVPEGDAPPCDREHRLTHRFNDPSDTRLGPEPYNVLVDEGEDYRYLYVAHNVGGGFTRLDLGDADREPQIVEQLQVFAGGNVVPGGFGLAKRPCFAAGEGPLGAADPEPNVPSLSKACTRPIVYGGFRYSPNVATFTITPLDPDEFGAATGLRALSVFTAGGLDPGTNASGARLGDIAFADPRGDRLYIVQTSPGALLQIDTSLDDKNEPANLPAAPPVELCQRPTSMVVHDDGVERLAFVSCFRSAQVFVVDLRSFRVIAEVLAGTGPHSLAVDAERQALYVANTLEATLSVIDISRDRPTRFSVIARLGLQEPLGL